MSCLVRHCRVAHAALLALPSALPLALVANAAAPTDVSFQSEAVSKGRATDPNGPLDLDTAADLALMGHPDLARYVFDRAAIEGRRLQAGLKPNPEIGVDLENFAGDGLYQGADSLEATLRLQLLVERTGKREARIGVADAQGDQLDIELTLARLDVLASTTRHFIDVAETQAQFELTRRGLEYAEQTLLAAQRRVQAGAASSLETNRARIAVERANLALEHHEHELSVRRRHLAAQWGATEASFSEVRSELLQLPVTPEYGEWLMRLRQSPHFARFDVERRLREADVTLARSQAVADPTFSAGVRRLQQTHDTALIASLLVPLPVRDRNQGNIAEALAVRDRLDRERRAAAVRSEAALYDLSQELKHARAQVESLRDTVIPQAREALGLTRRGYANGRYSQIDLLDAQRTLLELESEQLRNAADYHRTLAAIERMTALAPAARTGNPTP